MGFKEFMSEVRTRGVASRSHFIVELTPPPFLMSAPSVPIIPLFCEQAMFPEFVLPTQTIKDGGINREVVYDKLYGQMSMTFICDQQMMIKEFFDRWTKAPVRTNGGFFLYPSRYIVPTMTVYQIDEKKQLVYACELLNVYPKVMNDVMLSASDRSITSFQVVFAYETWNSWRIAADTSLPPAAPQQPAVDLNGITRSNPKFTPDIAGVLDLIKLGKDGAKSAIVTRGTMAIQDILTKTTRTAPTGGIPGLDIVRNVGGFL